jgi:hypothetical protein
MIGRSLNVFSMEGILTPSAAVVFALAQTPVER